MNALELRLEKLDSGLLNMFKESMNSVELLLSRYSSNFPTYTDHSIKHTKEVFKIASELLNKSEIESLNSDEIYILSMACLLHDIGMCLPSDMLIENAHSLQKKINADEDEADFIRDIHHELSNLFIKKEYELLKIPNEKYAEAIGLVAMGHRKVSLDDCELYPSKFFVKSGREFVCLPYLACILRLADELDITNIRTPKLLTKYYMPNNEKSIKEWEKHIATTQINYTEDKVIFEVNCSDQNNLAALEEQFEKIQNVSNYCQKTIRTIANTEDRKFELRVNQIAPKFKFISFDPKGIQFSFNVQNVVKTFIGEDLYHNELAAIREALQNSIDSCRYKKGIFKDLYNPEIKVTIHDDYILISDNGLGMDEFIVENFFGRLGSSFYEQQKVKNEFEAIGQFGVGVFSYFLLGEYIDIETKTEKGTPLRFRIDKDPKNYFHFFADPQRTESGTTITLYKKDKIKAKYNYSDYLTYIKDNFRYVDICIVVEGNEGVVNVQKKSFSLDPNDEITKRLKLHHNKTTGNYRLINFKIDNTDFEGECGMIVSNFKKNKSLSISNPYEIFDHDSFRNINRRHDRSQIGFSQKGVFVNHYSSSKLSLIIGNINLKKGKKISINRGEFSDTESIESVIEEFEIGIIDNLFKELRVGYTDNVLYKLSDEFLISYFGSYYFDRDDNNDSFLNVLKDNISIKIIRNSIESIEKLNVLKKENRFILLSSIENKKEIIKSIKDPIVIGSNFIYDGSFLSLRNIFNSIFRFTPFIELYQNKAYLVFKMDGFDEYHKNHKKLSSFVDYDFEFLEVNSELISVKLSKDKIELKKYDNYSEDCYINTSHPYNIYILENYKGVKEDASLCKVISNSFEIIQKITNSKKSIKKDLSQLNNLLLLFGIGNIPYVFSEKDFQ